MAVGVLALQGSFNEHITALKRFGVKGVEIRRPDQLANVSALIIPGGESTTMAKLAQYHNLEKTGSKEKVIVAVKQGNLLGTIFHPELTADTRWHSYFLKTVDKLGEQTPNCFTIAEGESSNNNQQPRTELSIFQ